MKNMDKVKSIPFESYSEAGINISGRSSGKYRTICPKCEPRRKTKGIKALAVNLNEQVWYCHHCFWAGFIVKDINNKPYKPKWQEPINNISESDMQEEPTINQNTVKPQHKELELKELTPEALKLLYLRGISVETAIACGVKSTEMFSHKLGKKTEALAFCVYENDDIVNIKYRAVSVKDFSQTKNGDQDSLFNNQNISGDSIIITEGEFDALACYEAGFHSVVSVPNGAPPPNVKDAEGKLSWVDANNDYFRVMDKVILAMDKDAPGLNYEKLIAEKIGYDKCFTVNYPEGCKDANDVLLTHGIEALKQSIETAKPFPVEGITVFADHRDAIMDYCKNRGQKNLFSTGLDSVDKFLRLQLGTLNILTGVPSHGKSEFLDQIIVNTIVNHQWRWAIFSPENYPLPNHFQKMAEKIVKKPLFNPADDKKWNTNIMTEDEIDKAITLLSKYVKVLTQQELGSSLESILNRVNVCIQRDKINAFVIDPFNELEHQRTPGLSETEYISQFLSRIRNFARFHNVMAWIVAHPAKLQKVPAPKDYQGEDKMVYPVPTPYDISGSAHWRNKADTCLCIHRDISINDGKIELHIQKIRNKNAGRAGEKVLLHWTAETGIISCGHRYNNYQDFNK